jgi:hypothetical protein
VNNQINDISIIESCIVNDLSIDSLCKKILESEPHIKNLVTHKKSTFDYVNNDSITKYHNYYNLIEFNFDEVNLIVKKIKELILKINDWDKFYLKMWANIYRKGDYIGYHTHLPNLPGIEKNPKALSGHCFLFSSEPTYTTYYFRRLNNKISILGEGNVNSVDILNVLGEISIFSSYVPHEFKKWDGDLRIGIAFDISHETMGNPKELEESKYILV